LLDVFWSGHDASEPPISDQYKSVIFYHNEEQKQLAIESRRNEETRLGKNIYTEVVPFKRFYLAEDYHQKYLLRHDRELMKDFNAIYPAIEDFVASTAAARINGYLGGYGSLETLQKDINSYGLSETGKNKLLEIANKGLILACSVPW
jgi:peptide-methionine (S)-S-oxide reductase